LRGGSSDHGRDGSPLCRHQQVREFLVLDPSLKAATSDMASGNVRDKAIRTFDHPLFFIDESGHSHHPALHCFGVLRISKNDDIVATKLV
jgi:hypothetical protein